MPIGKIRKAGRYLVRYREIFAILVKYGLADWAQRVNLDFVREIISLQAPKELQALSTEERIRHALVELGPTFIKFGQILSVRPDIVGVPLSDELKELQTNVTPDPLESVERIIESEFDAPIEELFEKFESIPVASASIGQVHKAQLKSGKNVAVKVRHEGIEKTVATDLEILKDLAQLAEDYVDDAKYYRPKETVERFARTLTREMDFMREARNIINLKEDMSGDSDIKIPMVYEDLTSSKVLVMEWLDGVPINKVDAKTFEKVDSSSVAEKIAKAFLSMILINGFYHADPHPGNIMLTDDGKIALLDFGMVGRLSSKMREHVEDMVSAVVAKDSDRLARVIVKAGSLPPDLNEQALGGDVTDFISYYGAMPAQKIKLSTALNEMMSIIHRNHIMLPSEVVLLMKTLVTLEGTNRELSPEFNLLSLTRPYQESIAMSVLFQPWRRIAKTKRFYYEIQDFVETVPSALADIIERFRRETLEIHMEHRGLEHSANRLVFGILTAAMFIGSSLVLSASVPPLFFGLSLFGVIGYFVSLIMGARILWAIMIHGKLD